MRFSGEIKFPDVDHPGVPVGFVIDDAQAEVQLDGESLGRWSLYDVHARRLVGNAFAVDLDGTEVTFLAEDPIDFAYRGVEHMAETWAALKAKSIATRGVAVRKSRKGTSPSRLSDLREAMLDNLSGQVESRLTGGSASTGPRAPTVRRFETRDEEVFTGNAPAPAPAKPPPVIPDIGSGDLEEERRQLVEMRAQLERELREAEQREGDRIEAFRIEMQRLEAERAALEQERLKLAGISPAATEDDLPYESFDTGEVEETSGASSLREALETVTDSEPEADPERDVEPEPEVDPEPEPEAEPEPEPEAEPEPEPEAEPQVAIVNNTEAPDSQAASEPIPEPAMAGANGDKAGLMGAVRAAFTRGGGRVHEHHFVTAPGGIGITRFVCEECGYVSISVGDD